MFDAETVFQNQVQTPIETITTSMSEAALHGYLIYDFLALRKRVFIDQLNWKIDHDQMVEMDQYDCDDAKYVLALRQGAVVGGVRLLPTSARMGRGGCMIEDALENKIVIFPENFTLNTIKNPETWEGTRLVISKDLLPAQGLRRQCFSKILFGIREVLLENNSKYLVTISNVSMEKLLPAFGYAPLRIDQAFTCLDDGKKYAVYKTDFAQEHVHDT